VVSSLIDAVLADCTPRRLAQAEAAVLIPDAGPAMVIPLRTSDTVAGAVVVLRRRGAAHFDDTQLDMTAAFADQAAMAWQLATTRRRMHEIGIIAERDRIARDLHDHVIQRLFAVGLSLQSSIPRTSDSEAQKRLAATVDELQNVIQEIRSTIFELNDGATGPNRLLQRIGEAISAFAGAGPSITASYLGPLSVVKPPLSDHAEAVVREAVSNAVRHADASAVSVTVRVEDDLSIEVIDDGCGMPADVTSSGLSNLRARAAALGGDMIVSESPGGGTVLRWTAPL
jgi:hypothetical protein